MTPTLQREVNALVMEALRPVVEGAGAFLVPESEWNGWGAGSGGSLADPSAPAGVHVEGFRGRMRFHLPYPVARQLAERYAADHPDELARIRSEWWDEMAHDARDYGDDALDEIAEDA